MSERAPDEAPIQTDPDLIALAEWERRLGDYVGRARRAAAISLGLGDKYGIRAKAMTEDEKIRADVDGAHAEIVAARRINRYPVLLVGRGQRHDEPDIRPDVEVRSSTGSWPLFLHEDPKDSSAFRYVLVKKLEDAPLVWRVFGWISGKEGKQRKFWREDIPSAAYVVPFGALHPMSEFDAKD